MHEALRMQQRLLSADVTAAIQAEILLLNAGKDTTVKARPQQRFAKKIKHCTYQCFPTAKHTIYTGSNDILEEYYPTLFRFFG
jgi:alpha-beta hydrolase superfamily lysophospholipase